MLRENKEDLNKNRRRHPKTHPDGTTPTNTRKSGYLKYAWTNWRWRSIAKAGRMEQDEEKRKEQEKKIKRNPTSPNAKTCL
ncbi:hypothetical protein CHS0354_004334 [Potamilus streckersoni]|uniref:Uncharacterized protein n=1 Tax=Potamilus streckersoni TaxID=2493646 RepID=A0AAE0VW65_9BIVA|nr:hypothetical protein CHS0354_004334 [Potamilus streckersoni]